MPAVVKRLGADSPKNSRRFEVSKHSAAGCLKGFLVRHILKVFPGLPVCSEGRNSKAEANFGTGSRVSDGESARRRASRAPRHTQRGKTPCGPILSTPCRGCF